MDSQYLHIVGRVGRQPELRTVGESGTSCLTFSVAASDAKKVTTWWRVTAWRKLADQAAQLIGKGSRVVVHGDLATRTWTGRDGEERSGLELRAASIIVLDRLPTEQQNEETPEETPF